MSESTQTNLRQRLRSATSESHAKLDGVMGLHPPFATPENYRRYLTGMDQLYKHCDASIRWVEARVGLATHEVSLRDLIHRDVASIGLTTADESPVPATLAAEASPGTHWGRAYVMEGSSIGATFLVKQAEEQLPDSFGKSFLQQLSTDAKHRWSIFAGELANADVDPDEAVNAAVDVFDYAYLIFGE